MQGRRVVITGLGLICPTGNTVAHAWAALLAGQSGIGTIDMFDVQTFSTQFAGLVRDFDVQQYGVSSKDARKMDPFIQYGVAAAVQAFQDAGFTITEANAPRTGVLIGSGIGGLGFIEKNHDTLRDEGARRISPFFIPGSIVNMIAGQVAILLGLKGPNVAIATACTTGCHSIGVAARMIAYGEADAMLAGGAEAACTPLGLGGFCAARALSVRNDSPADASRPWDADRDGFVLGEGAGVLMLESYDSAVARNAHIYAELVGFGMSSDAYHMTQPSVDGPARAMQLAMLDAKMPAEEIDYINAHGTSTRIGDLNETQAIKMAMGDAAKKVVVSSTKSMTGHLLGAAGAIEAVFSVLAIRDQVIPPTINLHRPDEGCDLDYAPNVARNTRVRAVMSNSFGFGGTNGALLFKQLD